MRIGQAVKRIQSVAGGWVRVEQIRTIPAGLELYLGIRKGRCGKRLEGWRIRCLGVRECQIADFDGGGLAMYSSAHPAARQFVPPQAVLRWNGKGGAGEIGALYASHIDSVDDWIPTNRYIDIQAILKRKSACRGPDFLLRRYAQVLRRIGLQPRLRLREERKATGARPKVLHFGDSFLVASAFVAERTQ